VARRATLRASDADRDAVAERLRNATAEGRLLAEELEDRLESLFAARTYGELDTLTADLPPKPPERRRQPAFSHWLVPAVLIAIVLPIVIAVVVAAAVFLLTGAFTVWLVWLVAGWWFFGHRRRSYPARRRVHVRRVDWTRF
jgi:Flp pilus assembly protein TadB